jgi:hypothetical protein
VRILLDDGASTVEAAVFAGAGDDEGGALARRHQGLRGGELGDLGGHGQAEAPIRFAFDTAVTVGARVAIVRAWWPNVAYSGYGGYSVAPDIDSLQAGEEADVATLVKAIRDEYPQVETTIRVIHGNPVPTLTNAARGSRPGTALALPDTCCGRTHRLTVCSGGGANCAPGPLRVQIQETSSWRPGGERPCSRTWHGNSL